MQCMKSKFGTLHFVVDFFFFKHFLFLSCQAPIHKAKEKGVLTQITFSGIIQALVNHAVCGIILVLFVVSDYEQFMNR